MATRMRTDFGFKVGMSLRLYKALSRRPQSQGMKLHASRFYDPRELIQSVQKKKKSRSQERPSEIKLQWVQAKMLMRAE